MGSQKAQLVPTPDGRELEVLASGLQDGFPLVFHHWTPGAAVPLAILERPATDRGLRVIAYSRPGCGRSTPRVDAATTATVADDATDTATILDHLALDQFVTIAWSGGGPRGLACAAMLAERCRAVATLACPVPPDAEGIDPLAGMRPENLVEYAAAAQGAEALTPFLEQRLAPLRSATDDQIVQALGTEDGNLGSVHGVWLGEHVPGARLHLVEGEGHISLITRIDQVLDDLVGQARLQLRPVSAAVIT